MISFAAIILLGFFLGMRHAMDPDHVVAVTTIVSRQRSVGKAALIGALWGLGHTFTIFLVGAAIILFNVAIPPRLGLSMELSVGVMLVLLGALNVTGILRRQPETGKREEGIGDRAQGTDDTGHSIRPLSTLATGNRQQEGSGLPFASLLPVLSSLSILRPLLVGIVHGLAGSAAVALLLMTTIPNPWWAIGYLLIFGVGTMAGMILITAVISLPFAYTATHLVWLNRGLATASGLLSLAFGFFLAYQIGFVDGLFTLHPEWTPR